MDAKASPEDRPITNKLDIKDRSKLTAQTSVGELYGRALTLGDIKTFGSQSSDKGFEDLGALGALALQTLGGEHSDPTNRTPLPPDVIGALTEDDERALAEAIARANGVERLPDGPAKEALGAVLKEQFQHWGKETARILQPMATAFKGQGESIGKLVQSVLKERTSALSAIKDSLLATSALEAARSARDGVGKSAIGDLFATGALGKPGQTAFQHALSELEGSRFMRDALGQDTPSKAAITLPELPRWTPPPEHETPIGRAAIAGEEAANTLREVAGLTAAMAAQVADLTGTIVTQAVPQWLDKLEADRKTEQQSLKQANDSLRWTKWAVIVSIGATFMATGWQVWLAREYKLENDVQQSRTEKLLEAQLVEAQALNQRLTEDARRLQVVLASMAPTAAAASNPASSMPSRQSPRTGGPTQSVPR